MATVPWKMCTGGTGVLEVRNASGALERSYSFGNVTWNLAAAANTDNQPGAELIVKAGPDVVIINHPNNTQNRYTLGNVLFDVAGTAQLDGTPGQEVIVRTGNALVLISDTNRTQRAVTDGISGTWQYQGAYTLAGMPYATLAYTAGNSLRLYDYNLQSGREFPTDGMTSVIGAADLNGVVGNELVARSSSNLLVVSGRARCRAEHLRRRYRLQLERPRRIRRHRWPARPGSHPGAAGQGARGASAHRAGQGLSGYRAPTPSTRWRIAMAWLAPRSPWSTAPTAPTSSTTASAPSNRSDPLRSRLLPGAPFPGSVREVSGRRYFSCRA